jgi:hypothetical protein
VYGGGREQRRDVQERFLELFNAADAAAVASTLVGAVRVGDRYGVSRTT